MTPLDAAIATGLPCFPCGRTKAPTIPGAGGHKHATAEFDKLQALWRDYPGSLVGVPTGEISGVDVLDIDAPRHAEAAAWFEANRARLPLTREHRTRSGGRHLLFCHAPGLRNSASRIAPGIDVRGDGGYVIWWPAAGCPVFSYAPLAQWPRWLLSLAANSNSNFRPARITDPDRRLDRPQFEGLLRQVKFARQSERNSRLFWAACRLGEAITRGEIAVTTAELALARAALHAGLPESEARRTISSAFRTTTGGA